MSIKQDIEDALKENGAMTIYQIAHAIGRKYSTWLRNHADEMVELGNLKRTPRKANNGRPTYVYSVVKLRNLRREFKSEQAKGYPFTYEMWLEEELKKCRNGG